MEDIRIMKKCLKLLFAFSMGFTLPGILCAQSITIGFKDSLRSEILNENRNIIISLPENYMNSEITYPVLYRLDGDLSLFVETVGTIHRLVYLEEVIPEMIVVMIKNTDRLRDMWVLNSESGPANFQRFLEEELIPFIDCKYRSSKDRVLCGQSLSSAFTLYSFLSSPGAFSSYIACSAGFPGGEEFYFNLAQRDLDPDLYTGIKIFMTNGLSDPYDPDKVIQQNSMEFFKLIEANDFTNSRYMSYENEGHVPFHSLYHGLKFIFE